MTTIYKYPIEITDFQILNVPKESKVLTVQVQNGRACLWLKVDPSMPEEEMKVYIFGTGHPMPVLDLDYIGSVQMFGGRGVFHVFLER